MRPWGGGEASARMFEASGCGKGQERLGHSGLQQPLPRTPQTAANCKTPRASGEA